MTTVGADMVDILESFDAERYQTATTAEQLQYLVNLSGLHYYKNCTMEAIQIKGTTSSVKPHTQLIPWYMSLRLQLRNPAGCYATPHTGKEVHQSKPMSLVQNN